MEKVFVSWSGGKDCCLACYEAVMDGLDVRYLVSIITKGNDRLWPHALSPEVMKMQAEAMGIPMIQWWTTVPEYDAEYRKMLLALKENGVTGGVFGDVSLGNSHAKRHRRWVESVCRPTGIKPYLPLWDRGREHILTELIDSGFEVIIIAVDDDKLGKGYLGRKLDTELLSELKLRHELSPTGEVGYYHTFVVDGPLFEKRLQILEADAVKYPDKIRRDGVWYLDIRKCQLETKSSQAEPIYAGVESTSFKVECEA